jgi:hypothetical protein
MPRSDGEDRPILTQDEEVLLLRVSRSKVWRLIRDALCLEREELFAGNSSISGLSGHPSTPEALWQNRGAILLIQHLLREGPRCVIWYNRYVAAKAEEQRQRNPKAPEREFGQTDLPNFDM